MNECEKYQEMISAMLDRELGPAESEQLIEHMSSCARCREFYELLSAVTGPSAWELPEPPNGLHEHIMSRVRQHAGQQRRNARIQRLRPWAATAACLVLIAGVVFGVPRFFRAGSIAPTAFNTTAAANNAAPADAAAPAQAEVPTDDNTASGGTHDDIKSALDGSAASDESGGLNEKIETEPESVPEPAQEPVEPPVLDIDIAKSTVTVESGGNSTSEKLSRDDTLIWLNAVIEGRAANGIDAAKIEIFRLEGADYMVYIYHDGSKLMGSLSDELTDGVELKKLEDFTVFAQMFDADK